MSAGNKRKTGSDTEMETPDLVDVDFDFYDFKEIDYHSLGLLLRQLFSHDAGEFDIAALTNFMIEHKFGSTIKCDGEESDPYAFCTAVNLNTQQENAAIAQLTAYLLKKTTSTKAKPIHDLLSTLSTSESHTGLVLNERLINMPAQISAPLLRILGEEAQSATAEGKAYNFSQLVYFSRIFVPSGTSADDTTMDQEEEPTKPAPKKSKKKKHQSATQPAAPTAASNEFFAYHPEDEVIEKFATCVCDFDFDNSPERGEDAFGVETKGRLMLVPADKLVDIVSALEAEGQAA